MNTHTYLQGILLPISTYMHFCKVFLLPISTYMRIQGIFATYIYMYLHTCVFARYFCYLYQHACIFKVFLLPISTYMRIQGIFATYIYIHAFLQGIFATYIYIHAFLQGIFATYINIHAYSKYFCYLYLLHFGWHFFAICSHFIRIYVHTWESISCYTHICIYLKSNFMLHIHRKGTIFYYPFIFWKAISCHMLPFWEEFSCHFQHICILAKHLAIYPIYVRLIYLLLPTLWPTFPHHLGTKNPQGAAFIKCWPKRGTLPTCAHSHALLHSKTKAWVSRPKHIFEHLS